MVTLDWIVLISCSIGILYCLVTMPKPIISKEEWEKLPEKEIKLVAYYKGVALKEANAWQVWRRSRREAKRKKKQSVA